MSILKSAWCYLFGHRYRKPEDCMQALVCTRCTAVRSGIAFDYAGRFEASPNDKRNAMSGQQIQDEKLVREFGYKVESETVFRVVHVDGGGITLGQSGIDEATAINKAAFNLRKLIALKEKLKL